MQVRVVGVHLVEVEERPFLALVQEAAPGVDLGWQIEDCDFHMGPRGEATLVGGGGVGVGVGPLCERGGRLLLGSLRGGLGVCGVAD
jgi:hypothetical protein